MKLSVIMPVYNTEKYLQKSIESVIRQTYKDIEVILVDDGSTDGSGEICNQYAEAYNNFKVIHQENGGNVSARCRGAKEAMGEYVTFMDSDDWIAEDMYEELMKSAEEEKCDIVSQSGYTVYDNGKYYQVEGTTMLGTYKKGKGYDMFLSKMMYDEGRGCVGIGPSLSHKVIKREILDDVVEKIDKNIVFGLEFKNVYLFPYQLIDKGSRIILYGAGKVGQSYYGQIRKNAYCSIAAWADSNAYKEDENIISPMMIAEIEYSKIVIAIKSRKSAEEIIQSLVYLGVDREKIVWVEPPVMPLI